MNTNIEPQTRLLPKGSSLEAYAHAALDGLAWSAVLSATSLLMARIYALASANPPRNGLRVQYTCSLPTYPSFEIQMALGKLHSALESLIDLRDLIEAEFRDVDASCEIRSSAVKLVEFYGHGILFGVAIDSQLSDVICKLKPAVRCLIEHSEELHHIVDTNVEEQALHDLRDVLDSYHGNMTPNMTGEEFQKELQEEFPSEDIHDGTLWKLPRQMMAFESQDGIALAAANCRCRRSAGQVCEAPLQFEELNNPLNA